LHIRRKIDITAEEVVNKFPEKRRRLLFVIYFMLPTISPKTNAIA